MTKGSKFQFGPWEVVCSPADGARLQALRYHGLDLLTREPSAFRPPQADYGAYELRPVYGYDDCFPTVDPCTYPGLDWEVPDHGELCWRQWEEAAEPSELVCSVRSEHLPVYFTRRMRFSGQRLLWTFQVVNQGSTDLPFLHVMHPLMPLSSLTALDLPAASRVVDATTDAAIDCGHSVADWLGDVPVGSAVMLLMQEVAAGAFSMRFASGLQLQVSFPLDAFPTLGIWWNHRGYPDEDGCRRDEFAIEPIPGPNSRLADCEAAGQVLTAPADGHLEWSIEWEITNPT